MVEKKYKGWRVVTDGLAMGFGLIAGKLLSKKMNLTGNAETLTNGIGLAVGYIAVSTVRDSTSKPKESEKTFSLEDSTKYRDMVRNENKQTNDKSL